MSFYRRLSSIRFRRGQSSYRTVKKYLVGFINYPVGSHFRAGQLDQLTGNTLQIMGLTLLFLFCHGANTGGGDAHG